MARIAIVGGGIIGCSIALRLAEAGHLVTLIDKRQGLLEGSSRAAFGSLTPFSDPFFTGSAREFAFRSVSLYRERWLDAVKSESGLSVGWGDDGLLELLETPQEIRACEKLVEDLASDGYKANMISREEVLELEPALQGRYRAALWLDEPWIDHEQYFEALLRCIARHQAIQVLLSTLVESIDSGPAGVKIELREKGQIEVDYVVVSTGPTAHPVEGCGRIPLQWIRGDALMVRTLDDKPMLRRHVYKQNAFITPRQDGRMLLGASYADEVDDPRVLEQMSTDRITAGAALHLLQVNAEVVPRIKDCEVMKTWRGWRVKTPDGFPVLGFETPQVVIASGFIGLGVTMAPAAAEAVLELVESGQSRLIPTAFLPGNGRAG
jgi:glycine oxidase